MLLRKKPKEYYAAINPKNFNDVFESKHISLGRARKEIGEMQARAFLVLAITNFCNFVEVSKIIDEYQIAETAELILEEFYYLKIDDIKLCFNNAKKGKYGEIYRLDGLVIMGWLNQYVSDRTNAADDISYREYQSTKAFEPNRDVECETKRLQIEAERIMREQRMQREKEERVIDNLSKKISNKINKN